MIRPLPLLLFALFWSATAIATYAVERPNILVIFADDLGIGDVGCYGSEIKTPHIDSLARDGAKFESFYAASSICTPSRFGLLTGRYPNRSQDRLLGALMFYDEKDDARGLRSQEKTIAEYLAPAGYQTAVIGKWHLGHGRPEFLPSHHGFQHSYGMHGGALDYFTHRYGERPDWFRNDQPLEETGYATDLITEEAVRWLKERKDPFFLFLAYSAPHYGKGWDAINRKLTNPLQAKPADRERCQFIADPVRREFAGMVTGLDDGIGRVLETLRAQKLDQNTLVIFTSDNGGDPRYGGNNKPFRGQKAQLFEGGIREPCLMLWPGKLKPGTVFTEPATALDLFPTFCDLAGVARSELSLDGQSLLPWWLEGKPLPERDLFWQLSAAGALRRGSWKFVHDGKEDMLFDLATDPVETKNLATNKPDLLARLKSAHADIAKTFRKNSPTVP